MAMDIKNILVPVDFSPPSTVALDYGIALARQFRARLTLLNVVEPLTPLLYTFPVEAAETEKQRCEQAERLLSALVAPEDTDDLDLHTIVKSGNVHEEILETVHDEHADMVVMGTHGRGFLGRLFIGSVTQSILREITVPILTVCRVDRPLKLTRILFATDLSETALEGFRFVRELAKKAGSEIVVLHSIEPVTYVGPEMAVYFNENFVEEAKDRLKAFADEALRDHVPVETVVDAGFASERIFKAADENAMDLIAITLENRGRLEKALLGTTAERVIREARLPVLSIPVATAVEVHQDARTPATNFIPTPVPS
jgi:nucleotide-binding universal stress UspA family protein